MAYIKFKELSKYFDFKLEVEEKDLPDYTKEYVETNEKRIYGDIFECNDELKNISLMRLIQRLMLVSRMLL